LGVSYIFSGEPAEAEKVLRRALETPGATLETRQNLALAIGLQGRFEEAERLSRADLPADMASANIDYLRALLQEGRRWSRP
jgi:Flp pilus assembly protein TadD